MRRAAAWTAILAACFAACAQAAEDEAAVKAAREVLAAAARSLPEQQYDKWPAVRAAGWEAVKGKPDVLKLLASAAEGPDVAVEARWLALGLLAEQDTTGAFARRAMGVLVDYTAMPAEKWGTCWERARSDVQVWLFRRLDDPKDIEKIVDSVLGDRQSAMAFVSRAVFQLPSKGRVRVCLLMLDRAEEPSVWSMMLAHLANYFGGEEVRRKLYDIATDEKRGPMFRRQAATAWAARCTRADYDRVEEVLRAARMNENWPADDVLGTLATLDYARARAAFNEAWKTQPNKTVLTRARLDLADESQIRETIAQAVGKMADPDPNVSREAAQTLVRVGAREFDKRFLDEAPARRDVVRMTLALCFELGIDPVPYLKHDAEFGPAEEALRMSASWINSPYLSERVRAALAPDYTALALRILAQYPADRDDMEEWEKQEVSDAFSTLCLMSPEQAEPFVDRLGRKCSLSAIPFLRKPGVKQALVRMFRDDLLKEDPAKESWAGPIPVLPLVRAGGAEQAAFALETARRFPAPKRLTAVKLVSVADPRLAFPEFANIPEGTEDSARAEDMAVRLVQTGEALGDEERKFVEATLPAALRDAAPSARLGLAVTLAGPGDAEAEKAVEGFLKGDWRPASPSLSVLAMCPRLASGPETPALARWKKIVVRAVTEPPDPSARAAVINSVRPFLGFRDGDGGDFPLVEKLLSFLDSGQDWRVRQQSGLALRIAFRNVKGDWDYCPWWTPERQKESAGAIRKWWGGNKDRLRWVVEDPDGRSGVFAWAAQ